MSKAPSKRSRILRSRTFTGCLVCRSRKVKCDHGQPSCANCLRLGLNCPGYGVVLAWQPAWTPSSEGTNVDKPPQADGPGGRRARAEVMSGHQRKLEAAKLLSHLGDKPTCSDLDALLDDLDRRASESEELSTGSPRFQAENGPYTVFSVDMEPDIGSSSASEMSSGIGSSLAPANSNGIDTPFIAVTALPDRALDLDPVASQAWNNSEVPSALNIDLGDFAIMQSDIFSDLVPEFPMTSTDIGPGPHMEQWSTPVRRQASFRPETPTGRFSAGSPYLPSELRYLLHHYDTHVIDSLSALPLAGEDAPWRRLHLASALRAYGELDVLQHSGFARVSLLYSLLSLTCFHLTSMYDYATEDALDPAADQMPSASMTSARQWQEQGQRFRGIARTAFQKQIKEDYSCRKNYKEMLMAALSLVCVGIVSGDSWDARLYLRHFQSIMRRGRQNKRYFSDKAVELHRMFAFIEAVERSTFCHSQDVYIDVLESNNSSTSDVSLIKAEPYNDQMDAGILATIDDPGVTNLPQSTTSENAGFVDIWGTPRKLVVLLANTTDLIMKIDAHCDALKCSRFVLPDSLLNEASALEHSICSSIAEWEGFLEMSPLLSDEGLMSEQAGLSIEAIKKDEVGDVMAAYIRMALHHALLVYFFREVRKTHPRVLQHYVRKVVTCLELHQSAKTRFFPSRRIGTFVWPSFIVACEALDPGLRSRAIRCMRHAGWIGFRNGEMAESVAREVWRQRDAGDLTVSWRDVTRHRKVFMLLT